MFCIVKSIVWFLYNGKIVIIRLKKLILKKNLAVHGKITKFQSNRNHFVSLILASLIILQTQIKISKIAQ